MERRMTTTSTQLYNWGKQLLGKDFVGVFPLDRLPPLSILKSGHCFIVNTQPHHLAGEHWIAVKVNQFTIQVFDPLGAAAYPHSLVNYLHKDGQRRHVVYNNKHVQDPKSKTCGYHCMEWLLKK